MVVTVLLDDSRGGVTPVTPSWGDRLRARMFTGGLDAELAAGASPDTSIQRSLRARTLIAMSTRRSLARTTLRLVRVANGPIRYAGPVPINRSAVRASSPELHQLAARLVRPGPVTVRGAAAASTIMSSACGAEFRGIGAAERLRAELREVIAALDALGSQ